MLQTIWPTLIFKAPEKNQYSLICFMIKKTLKIFKWVVLSLQNAFQGKGTH